MDAGILRQDEVRYELSCQLLFLIICVAIGSSVALIITNKLCKLRLSLPTKYNTVSAARCSFRSQGLVKGFSVLGVLLAAAVMKEQRWKSTRSKTRPQKLPLTLNSHLPLFLLNAMIGRQSQKLKGDALFKSTCCLYQLGSLAPHQTFSGKPY